MLFTGPEACVNITVVDDKMVERDVGFLRESFKVTLNSTENKVIFEESKTTARVDIMDDDSTLLLSVCMCTISLSLPQLCRWE